MTKLVYKSLLRLYPWDYMTAFATEMLSTFLEASEEQRRQGWGPFLSFLLCEFSSLIAGAVTEWIAKLTADVSVRGRHLPDLRMMRPSRISKELWFAAAGVNVKQ